MMRRFIAILITIIAFAPAVAQRAKVTYKAPVAKSQRAVATKNLRPSNDIIVSGEKSKNSAYKNLVAQQSMLNDQLAALDDKRATATKGQTKKIGKQMEALASQLEVVNRLIATFPTQRDYNDVDFERNDKAFRATLDSIAKLRIAASDPFAGRLSDDPELDRMYRDYIASQRNTPHNSVGSDDSQSDYGEPMQYSGDKTYRIMIAISRNAMKPSDFHGLTGIIEQRMPSGGYVYYQGSYNSKVDADRACLSILAGRKFRDAFVVAMVGNRRVAL